MCRSVRWLLVVALAGCGAEQTSSQSSPVLSSNGIWENGLATNGIWENGIWENGIWENGVFQNGIWENGIWENGIWENGIWENGIWENGVWEGNLAAQELLRTNPYAGQLLQYIYSCAMPAGTSKVLDPDGANVLLEDAIGLAPAWDSPDGECDQTCQRWVSACVLARTNAYGVHVQISMRAPDTAPAHIKAALETTVDERTDWSKREGAYYGNLFQTTPMCDGVVDSDEGCAGTSTIANTPKLYACAGPVSNIPEITKRFCSSQGDNGPITPVGECIAINPTPANPSACTSIDDVDVGALRSCYDAPGTANPTEYDEVITVYLKDPISVCGNQVCEEDEGAGDPNACPSDCHPGGWAKDFIANFGVFALDSFTFDGTSAVSPVGDAIYLGGRKDYDVDLGGGILPLADGGIAVAKYTPAGQHIWSKSIDVGTVGMAAIAATSDGGVVIGAFQPGGIQLAKIVKLNSDGAIEKQTTVGSSDNWTRVGGFIKADAQGNIYVAGWANSDQTFDTATFDGDSDPASYVIKLDSNLDELWVKQFQQPTTGDDLIERIEVDPNGAVLLSIRYGFASLIESNQFIKLDPTTGDRIWEDQTIGASFWSDPSDPDAWWLNHNGIAGDAAGNVYFSGFFHGSYDFEGDCSTLNSGPGNAFYVARYGTDGQCDKVVMTAADCTNIQHCRASASGGAIAFDQEGNIIVGAYIDGMGDLPNATGPGARYDFGAGPFENYRLPDAVFVSYTPDLEFRWAKHVPMVLYGSIRGMHLTQDNKIVVSGTYSGSMTIDGYFLVSSSPQQIAVPATYLASIPAAVYEPTPPALANVPETIMKEATSAAGAEVFFTPPTATDPGNDGVTVACTPRPWDVFPIGTTTVNCTATDPFGHASSASFDVIVRDTLGPMIGNVPAGGITTNATGATTPVSWPAVTAVDQIDGVRPVSCVPSSGTGFQWGTTPVTCTASDASGNVSTTTFDVTLDNPFSWSGFLQPINSDGSSIFKIGSTLPVKFQLTGWSADVTYLNATISLTKLSDTGIGTVVEAVSTGQADSGTTFRYAGGLYIFNLSLKNLTAGSYRIGVDMGDGVDRSVIVTLKK